MKIKGYLKTEFSKSKLQALYLAAKLEMGRYKDVRQNEWTEGLTDLHYGMDKIWGYLHFSEEPNKEVISMDEWKAVLFVARVELKRYKDFEVRHLRSDLQDLDAAVMDLMTALTLAEKVTA